MGFFVRILIADDHEMLRYGVRRLIEQRAEWVVCAEAGNGREAVDLTTMLRPDVVILDVAMPEMNGLQATAAIAAMSPAPRILLLAAHASAAIVDEGLRSGARGFLLKTEAATELIGAIEELLAGRSYRSSQLRGPATEVAPIPEILPASPVAGLLSPREREVVRLVATGRTSREVAAILRISAKTAGAHRMNAMRKLGVHSVVGLVHYAVRTRMVPA